MRNREAGTAATTFVPAETDDAASATQRRALARSAALCHRSSARFARHLRTIASTSSRREWLQRGDRCRLSLEDGRDEARVRLALERLLPRQHLVQDATKREDIGAGVSLGAFDLLGRHVLERSEDHAARREGLWRGRRQHRHAAGRDRRDRRFREAEIKQFGARFGQHDVGGFEITMHNARAMRGCHASAIWIAIVSASVRGRPGPLDAARAMRSASVSPSRYSMTRNAVPACSPTS